jgi:hypothetical protein
MREGSGTAVNVDLRTTYLGLELRNPLPPQTELTYPKGYGYGVSFPLRLSQDIVLQFITKAEWESLSQP